MSRPREAALVVVHPSVPCRLRVLAVAHRFVRCQCEALAVIGRFIQASASRRLHRGSNHRPHFVHNDSNRMPAEMSIASQVSRAAEINRSRTGVAKSTASSEIAETNSKTETVLREITTRFATERMVNSQTGTGGFARIGGTTSSRSVQQAGSETGIGAATIGGMGTVAISLTVRG